MITLGIETSTSHGSLAILDCNETSFTIIATGARMPAGAFSKKIIPEIEDMLHRSGLNKKNIALIAVSKGPGSFTGLRVGISTAKGLAFGLNIPLIGVDSLMSCAFPFLDRYEKVGVCFDAKREEVYGAGFCRMCDVPEIIIETSIYSISEFLKICDDHKIFTIIADHKLHKDCEKKITVISPEFPDAVSTAKLGYLKFIRDGGESIESFSPEYLRDFTPGKVR